MAKKVKPPVFIPPVPVATPQGLTPAPVAPVAQASVPAFQPSQATNTAMLDMASRTGQLSPEQIEEIRRRLASAGGSAEEELYKSGYVPPWTKWGN